MTKEEKDHVLSCVGSNMAKLRYEISQGDVIGVEMCLRRMLKTVSEFLEKATPEELRRGD